MTLLLRAPWFSVCAGVVFLAAWLLLVPPTPGRAGRGQGKGCGGNLGGTLEAVGKGAPVVSPAEPKARLL